MFIRCEYFHFSVSVAAFYFLFKILLQINFEINQCVLTAMKFLLIKLLPRVNSSIAFNSRNKDRISMKLLMKLFPGNYVYVRLHYEIKFVCFVVTTTEK